MYTSLTTPTLSTLGVDSTGAILDYLSYKQLLSLGKVSNRLCSRVNHWHARDEVEARTIMQTVIYDKVLLSRRIGKLPEPIIRAYKHYQDLVIRLKIEGITPSQEEKITGSVATLLLTPSTDSTRREREDVPFGTVFTYHQDLTMLMESCSSIRTLNNKGKRRRQPVKPQSLSVDLIKYQIILIFQCCAHLIKIQSTTKGYLLAKRYVQDRFRRWTQSLEHLHMDFIQQSQFLQMIVLPLWENLFEKVIANHPLDQDLLVDITSE